jgi:serine/threonine-protein kinase
MALRATRLHQIDCPQCGAKIDAASATAFEHVACPDCGRRTRVPVEMGPLLIKVKLGAGGSGVIYGAFDRQLKKTVAVKIPYGQGDSDARTRRTLQEAEALRSLNHPNIVSILRIGNYQGQPFIEMELLSGGSVQDRLNKRKKLDELEALQIGLGAADGLRAAATIGLLHLDIKPMNIVFDAEGTPKLLDFGYGSSNTADPSEIPGTPFYVAPELVRRLPPDVQCDMYSLGLTLFHMLTGKLPWVGRDVKETVNARLNAIAPNVRQVNRELHFRTGSAVARMLYEDPEERHEDYDDLIGDLQAARNAVRDERAGK